jgi:hypothetical protein
MRNTLSNPPVSGPGWRSGVKMTRTRMPRQSDRGGRTMTVWLFRRAASTWPSTPGPPAWPAVDGSTAARPRRVPGGRPRGPRRASRGAGRRSCRRPPSSAPPGSAATARRARSPRPVPVSTGPGRYAIRRRSRTGPDGGRGRPARRSTRPTSQTSAPPRPGRRPPAAGRTRPMASAVTPSRNAHVRSGSPAITPATTPRTAGPDAPRPGWPVRATTSAAGPPTSSTTPIRVPGRAWAAVPVLRAARSTATPARQLPSDIPWAAPPGRYGGHQTVGATAHRSSRTPDSRATTRTDPRAISPHATRRAARCRPRASSRYAAPQATVPAAVL